MDDMLLLSYHNIDNIAYFQQDDNCKKKFIRKPVTVNTVDYDYEFTTVEIIGMRKHLWQGGPSE
jgi:hypothetical protein